MSFTATLVRCSHKLSPSSQRWLGRQFRDPLVKQRMSEPNRYRSRSAFKLLEIDGRYKFFDYKDVRSVVDLGAAPGGWSQVAASKFGWAIEDVVGSRTLKNKKSREQSEELEEGFGLNAAARAEAYGSWSTPVSDDVDAAEEEIANPTKRGRAKVIAVDLLPIYPIPGVKTLQMDFLSPEADSVINSLLLDSSEDPLQDVGKADIILSDMAANFTGNRTRDIESSLRICETVFQFTMRHMRTASELGRLRGGVLVIKHFQHPYLDEFKRDYLEKGFHRVYFFKPQSSRDESSEGYWICVGWNGFSPESS